MEECKIGNLMVKDLETGKAEAVVTAPTPPPVKDNHEASGKSPDTVPASTSNYSKKGKVELKFQKTWLMM